MDLSAPVWFFLLPAVAAVVILHTVGSRPAALRFSSTAHARRTKASLRQRLRFLPLALRVVCLVLLTAALARPQKGTEHIRDVSKGIAIEMVVDRSGSMKAEMMHQGEQLTRLDVVKLVFKEFVTGNDDGLDGRGNDLIGMIAFAGYADTVCPLTLAHGALLRFADTVKLATRRHEDGTAIGDAVALAAARLKTVAESLTRQGGDVDRDYEIKSKIIILLTDGQNNRGKRGVEEAAKLAADWGIKIYAIGIGGGEGVMTVPTVFGPFKRAVGGGVDEATLRLLAETTNGAFYLAEDAESLRGIYQKIDQLERSEFESIRYVDYQERFKPFALSALGLLALEIFLLCTVFRKIP